MNTLIEKKRIPGTVLNVLAGAGFVALVALGVWLAVYSTRFVPSVVTRIGSAAVYLGSVFAPAPAPAPSTATATPAASIQLGGSSSITSPAPAKSKSAAATAGARTSGAYQIGGTPASSALSGLPDLIVTINAVGYLTSTSTDSFVASSTVPFGNRPAVRFTIKNVGTNAAGPWRFSASIPAQTAYIFQSQLQQSLVPGDRIEYTLGFDQPNRGFSQTISISANFDHAVAESNPNNNSDSAKITILGN